MSQQTINTGTNANDGTGDSLRLSMQKINNNFDELYNPVQTQIHVPASTTILPSWNGAIVIITAPNVVLTVPADLPVITFDAITRPTATCNFALSGSKSWVNGTPTLVPEKSTFVFVVDSLNSNEIYVEVEKVTLPYFYKHRGAITFTGTTVETAILVIPIGLVTSDTILRITDLIFTAEGVGVVNTSGDAIIRLRISDSTTINTTGSNLLATANMRSNTDTFDGWAKMERTFLFETLEGSPTAYRTRNATASAPLTLDTFLLPTNTNLPFGQFSNNKFIHVTVELPSSPNNITLRSCIINKL